MGARHGLPARWDRARARNGMVKGPIRPFSHRIGREPVAQHDPMKPSHKTPLFAGLTVFAAFFLGRLHTVFLDRFTALRTLGSDNVWWWTIQRKLALHEGRLPDDLQARLSFRLKSDVLFQKAAIASSRIAHLDLYVTNLILTGAIFCGAAVAIFLFAQSVLRNHLLAFILALAILQSQYGHFLAYIVVTPKLFGFLFFPLMLCLFVNYLRSWRISLPLFALLTALSCAAYLVTAIYTLPAVLCAAVMVVVLAEGRIDLGSSKLRSAAALCLSALVIMAIVFVVIAPHYSQDGIPERERTQIAYADYYFHAIAFYVYEHMILFGAVIGSLFLMRTRLSIDTEVGRIYLFLLIVYLSLLAESSASLALFDHSSQLRGLWLWRASNYAYVPALALIFLTLMEAPIFSRRKWGERSRIAAAIVLAAAFAIMAPSRDGNAIGAMSYAMSGSQRDAERNRALRELVAFSRTLPAESVILMPPLERQGAATDLFEAESDVSVALSRADRIHALKQTRYTDPYLDDVLAYRRIDAFESTASWAAAFADFARARGASHALFAAADWNRRKDGGFAVIFANDGWVLVAFDAPGG